jgi:N-glycosylase/DNA lyase
LALIAHYFNLDTNLTKLYLQWSELDSNFKRKALKFTGIRILCQDAWEALVSFICSSNNNISRISQMVEKLCVNYGALIGTFDDYSYYGFPSPEALIGCDVESRLRELGFGYRAKYIHQTAVAVAREREGWLDSLRNPENPALGVNRAPGDEMTPEGRQGYREAHQKLLELHGVGPKVADCVCLMGLGWGEAVPIDTHGMSSLYESISILH